MRMWALITIPALILVTATALITLVTVRRPDGVVLALAIALWLLGAINVRNEIRERRRP